MTTKNLPTAIILSNNLPWFAKGLEGRTLAYLGAHYLNGTKVIVTENRIPGDSHKMFFYMHQIEEIIY